SFDGKLYSAVSWQHARVDISGTAASITDLGSSNGTFLNGAQVAGSQPLRQGDIIGLGQTGPKLRVVDLGLARGVTATHTAKLLPQGMLTRPPATKPFSVSGDSLMAQPVKKRRVPVAGIVLGTLALVAVTSAGYVVLSGQKNGETKSEQVAEVSKD